MSTYRTKKAKEIILIDSVVFNEQYFTDLVILYKFQKYYPYIQNKVLDIYKFGQTARLIYNNNGVRKSINL